MIIDSSVLIAILEAEPEAEILAEAIEKDTTRFISAVSLVETTIVIENRRGIEGANSLKLLLEHIEIEVLPVTEEQAVIACKAFRDFGKGRHPAKLNFGDCFSYAAAKFMDEPLLFKGNDFNKSDIVCSIIWNID